jgi:SAM-dependent methyltransferase
MKEFWNQRYAEEVFAYGEEPNDFVRQMTGTFAPGSRILLLAEGQGRNAVWLARHGHKAVAVDQSEVGLKRTHELAAKYGVTVETVAADLMTWTAEPNSFDAVVAVFAHLPASGRAHMHKMAVEALKPGGIAVVEVYSPRQLEHKTGGPPNIELLVEPEALRAEFAGLEIERCEELERDVFEGPYHCGRAAVVQLLGRKP